MINPDEINAQFQQYLGRPATQGELQEFQRYGNSGYVDLGASDIGQMLQSHPEVQQRQLQSYGQQYEGALGASDNRLLSLAQDQIKGDFARQGRQPAGSSYTAAFANAAQNLAMQRQSSLASFYGRGYEGIMANSVAQGRDAQQFGRNTLTAARDRQFAEQDYYRGRDDFAGDLRTQSTRNLQGALTNAAVNLPGQLGSAYMLGGMGGGGAAGTPAVGRYLSGQASGGLGQAGRTPGLYNYPNRQ